MLQDKVASAKKIDSLLKTIVASGGFRLKYRITVNPPATGHDLSTPEILVELAGPDSDLVLERGGELLRALELITHESLHTHAEDHDKIAFDCKGYRAARQQELRAAVATWFSIPKITSLRGLLRADSLIRLCHHLYHAAKRGAAWALRSVC